jgi:hypothetical protein
MELIEDYRKTMQPMIDPDDDDLATHKRPAVPFGIDNN